jgi:myosin heavy subunit
MRQQVSRIQTEKPTVSDGLRRDIERDKKQIQSQKNQIETLQEKVSNLSAQFNAETSRLKQTTEDNAELQRDTKRLNETKEEIELAKNQAHEILADLRNETESEIRALREELAEAKEKAVQDSAGLERLKQQCKDAIDKANKERDRQIEALQSQLSGSRAELHTEQDEYDSLLNETEQAYKQENQTWEKILAESATKAKQHEAQKLQAESDHKRKLEDLQTKMDKQRASMKEENEELRALLEAAEEKLQTCQRPSSIASKTSTRLQVPYTNDGIPSTKTPNTDIISTQPSKPRKIIDRTKSEKREVDPVRAPEEIRPDSRRTNSATEQSTVKGPVVEESQFLSNPESMSQPVSQMIAETQLEDTLPTFAALHGKAHSTQVLSSFASSTSDPAHAAYGMERVAERGYPDTRVIKAYEQSPQQSDLPQSQHTQASANREQSQTSSQDENEKYNFSMPKPTPNSGSRRVPSVPPPSNLVKRRESNQRSGSGRYQTPIFDTAADNAGGTRMSSSHTSSPAFVQQTQSKRRKMYRTPKQIGGKQGSLHTDAGRIVDPRLAGRDQLGTKRKLVTEGYEDERKKRLAVSGNGPEKDNRRTHPRHPQSINDLPALDSQSTGSQTRMQTIAGVNTRATRSTRKLSQSELPIY